MSITEKKRRANPALGKVRKKKRPKPRPIFTNQEIGWGLFGKLLSALERKLPPFDQVQTLEYPIPTSMKKGSVEHAIFLLCSCYYMRGKINSNTALDLLGLLYTKIPWIFRPQQFHHLTERSTAGLSQYIANQLTENGLGFNATEVGAQWVHNMSLLANHWESNPISIFEKAGGDYEVLCTILMKSRRSKDPSHGFYGFREKMVSMLSYFYIHAEIISPFPHPVPVDFHILRMLVSHQVLGVKDMGGGSRLSVDRLSKAARALTLEYCRETGAEPRQLADALWHTSREFCVEHPGNRSSVGTYKGRRTPIIVKPLKWTPNDHERYHRTCGRCVAQDSCKWNIASANYYVQGVIVVRGAKEKPLDLFL